MEFIDSLLFLFVLLLFLWAIKADFFFIIFGIATFLYFIIILFYSNPVEIMLAVIYFIFMNPLGLILVFIPLILYSINVGIKKLMTNKKV
ncbi:MAG: hypothetical protein ACFE9T_11105 [Promethearchaeota archaeon]